MDLDQTIEHFEVVKNKYFEVKGETIRIEVRRSDELIVVELPKTGSTKARLVKEGFIEQVKRRIEF